MPVARTCWSGCHPPGFHGRVCDIVPPWSHAGSCAGAASSPWGALVLVLLLVYVAFFSGGSGAPPPPPPRDPPRRHRGRALSEALPAQPGLDRQRPDRHLRLRRRRALRRRRRDEPGQEPLDCAGHHHPAALLRHAAAHGQSRDRGDRWHLPGAPEQAVHLRRARLGHHRPQERHHLAGHRGQRPRHGLRPPGAVPEPDHRDPGAVSDHRHRQHRGAGLHALPGHDRRPAHRRSSRRHR